MRRAQRWRLGERLLSLLDEAGLERSVVASSSALSRWAPPMCWPCGSCAAWLRLCASSFGLK
ncbi:unnamed protein product [Effrenium voratum]|uniref:Uncharacterized protein n=1 Tax=Effrenium voratum TaxID=2562239 RepID=A0AA36MIK8_9DINO|nr:unnamed protein product [Effrenium voratum]